MKLDNKRMKTPFIIMQLYKVKSNETIGLNFIENVALHLYVKRLVPLYTCLFFNCTICFFVFHEVFLWILISPSLNRVLIYCGRKYKEEIKSGTLVVLNQNQSGYAIHELLE